MKIKLKKETSETCWVYWLYLRDQVLNTLLKKKKKTAHAYFGRLYFFKVFWRENYAILTRWYLLSFNNNNKTGACVFWAPVFFLSFLAGKLKIFNRGCKGKSLHKNWQSNLAKYVEFEFDTPCWRKTKTLRKSNEQNLVQFSASNLDALELL